LCHTRLLLLLLSWWWWYQTRLLLSPSTWLLVLWWPHGTVLVRMWVLLGRPHSRLLLLVLLGHVLVLWFCHTRLLLLLLLLLLWLLLLGARTSQTKQCSDGQVLEGLFVGKVHVCCGVLTVLTLHPQQMREDLQGLELLLRLLICSKLCLQLLLQPHGILLRLSQLTIGMSKETHSPFAAYAICAHLGPIP